MAIDKILTFSTNEEPLMEGVLNKINTFNQQLYEPG